MKEMINEELKLYYTISETDITLYDSDKKFLDCWERSEEMIEENPNYYLEALDMATLAVSVEQLIDCWMFNGHIVEKGEYFTNRIELANGTSVYLYMHDNINM